MLMVAVVEALVLLEEIVRHQTLVMEALEYL
jgi:hypothetical protein